MENQLAGDRGSPEQNADSRARQGGAFERFQYPRKGGPMRFWLPLIFSAALLAQSKKPTDLAAGKILVTTRATVDPIFAQSVVLLVKFDNDGAFGLMINRQTDIPISRALNELHGSATHSEPVFLGGPVQIDTVFALSRSPKKPAGATDIFGAVYLVSAKPELEKILGECNSGLG